MTTPVPVGLFDPLIAIPERAGVFSDFDGTLAPIVDVPEQARPVEGTAAILDDLAHTYAMVAVMSGRTVGFVAPLVPDSVVVSGLYGLERMVRGERQVHPLGGSWREVTDDIAALAAERGPRGLRVEDKELSITLHFREHPEIADEVRLWAEQQAARSGLVLRPAKMSFELHPPIEADKGTALLDLVDDLAAVCFLGDDIGDLAAFDALDGLEARGVAVVRVAVAHGETPAELVDRADLVVDGPEGALQVLRYLRDEATGHSRAS